MIAKTHEEKPWKEVERNGVITPQSLLEFFEAPGNLDDVALIEGRMAERDQAAFKEIENDALQYPEFFTSKPEPLEISMFSNPSSELRKRLEINE